MSKSEMPAGYFAPEAYFNHAIDLLAELRGARRREREITDAELEAIQQQILHGMEAMKERLTRF